IKEFFNDLKQIDVGSFFRGFAQGMGDMLKIFQGFTKLAGGKGLGALGWIFGSGRGIGRAFTIVGGLLKGTRHIWGFLGAGGGLLGKLLGGKIAKTGVFGKIASIFGKKKDIETAGDAAKSIPTVADTFKGAFSALQGLITTAGAVTLVAGTGFVAFKAAKSILNDLKDIGDILQDMTWLDAVHGVNIVASIGVFAKIFSAFGEALGPQGLLGVAIASAASFLVTGAFAADMWAIKQGVMNIRDTILEIDSVGEAITNMKGLAGINTGARSKLQTAVNAIREISDVLGGKSGSPMDRGEYSRGLPMFTSFKVNGIKNIASAVKQLQGVITSVNEIAVMGINPNVASRMDQVKRAVQAVEKALPGMLTNINGPANLAANTKSMAAGLKGLITMVKRINALASQSVNVKGFGALVQGIKDAMAQLEGMSEVLDLNIEVKLSDKFQQSVTLTIQKIKQAKKDIQNQTKSPVSFNIPVTVTFSVTTNLASALASINRDKLTLMSAGSGGVTHSGGATPNAGQKHGGIQQAKGGLIYRAKGGGVSFPGRPIGTDRIPAWLTAGEYVHNKRAVNTFGIDFMRKVNNLDVKGAMNELMHRAGHMANVNRGSVVNNTYNNNQKVVINNNGNSGAGFTFKRASRFVGAL
ncbi:MAG: hypothetical protein U0L88_01560, partial [Acutalibacteraceae bacterium]|nr:hypothetical protein [Acutalibacteraceae bacterium]